MQAAYLHSLVGCWFILMELVRITVGQVPLVELEFTCRIPLCTHLIILLHYLFNITSTFSSRLNPSMTQTNQRAELEVNT